MIGAESIGAIALAIAGRVAGAIVIATGKRIDPNHFLSLRGYRKRLLEKMEDMPFLYKDMRLSARDDYVEPQVATAVDAIQRSVGNPELNFQRPFMRFHESRRALLFGDGGYGKTTLFRHLTIRCLQQTRQKQILDGKRLVPIFVALKTARTSSDFPILDAIRRSDEYFDGEIGLKRIARLAKRSRLLVFLDGYDEMPHAGGMDHVQAELATIFGRFSSGRPDFFTSSDHGAIYRGLQNCRVYLSSRREFFFYSGFETCNEVKKWLVKGIGDRRIELVERIFENYRGVAEASSGLDLDSELFMQELKRTADAELSQLSKSPLFLTVMCFVYVSEIRSKGTSSVFNRGAYEIIGECISLLISELDAAKARGLSDAQRTALTNRRSIYPEEKKEFLRYFAVQLYEQSIGLFDKPFLIGAAERFFRGCDSPNRDLILRGINSSDPTVNVVEQIILSGIFVLVDRHKNADYFDFPHRRFREALAVSHFNDRKGSEFLAERLHDSTYSELILVYVEQSQFNDVVIEAMINEIVAGANSQSVADLFASALDRLPDLTAEEMFSRLLERISPSRVPQLPSGLLKYVVADSANRQLILEKIRYAISCRNDELLALWLRLAAEVDSVGAQAFLTSIIQEIEHPQLRTIVFSRLGSIDAKYASVVEAFLRKASQKNAAVLDLVNRFYFGRDEAARKKFKGFLSGMLFRLGDSQGAPGDLDLRVALGKAMDALASGDEDLLELGAALPVPKSPWRVN